MTKQFMVDQNTMLTGLQLMLAGKLSSSAQEIFDRLMVSGLDSNSLGFWVLDVPNNRELYSPTFRSSLQYSGEDDFPSVPKSWMDAIFPSDAELALESYYKHIASKGESRYIQKVRYRKKYSGFIEVICHGVVVKWGRDNDPIYMVGVHMPTSGLYSSVAEKFGASGNNVKFAEMMNFQIGSLVPIVDGVYLNMEEKSDSHWKGLCVMDRNSELARHYHSDQDEEFTVIEGHIKCLISGVEIRKGQTHIFRRGVTHLIYAYEPTEISIVGRYNPLKLK